jgi:WD40 repeat protein
MNRVSIWNVKTRQTTAEHDFIGRLGTVRFSADGGYLLVSGTKGNEPAFVAYGVADPKRVRWEQNLSPGLGSPVPSLDGNLLAVVGKDGGVRVWDRGQRQTIFAWTPHHPNTRPEFPGPDPSPMSTSVAFAPDGRTLATARGDQIRIWQLATDPTTVQPKVAPRGPIEKLQGTWTSMSIGPLQTRVTIRGNHFALRRIPKGANPDGLAPSPEFVGDMLDETTGDPPARFRIEDSKVSTSLQAIYRVEGDTLFLCVRKGKGSEYSTKFATNPATGDELFVLKRAEVPVILDLPWTDGPGADAIDHWPTFSPDGRYVLVSNTGGDRPTAAVWEAETGKRVAVIPAGGYAIFLPDSRHVLATGPDSRLVLWDLVADKEVRKFEKHAASGNTLSVSVDGTRAVSGDEGKTFVLWDVATGRPLAEFQSLHEGRFTVSISPDGKRIATVGLKDRQAILWEVENRRVIWAWKGTRRLFGPIAWLPEGRNFVTTVDADGAVVKFDERTAEPQVLFKAPPTKEVWNLSPDGRVALVHDDPASMRVVDLRGHGDLGRVTLPAPASGWMAVSPDGRLGVAKAAPAVAGGRVYVFRLPAAAPKK